LGTPNLKIEIEAVAVLPIEAYGKEITMLQVAA
jgi:hypothetical protein